MARGWRPVSADTTTMALRPHRVVGSVLAASILAYSAPSHEGFAGWVLYDAIGLACVIAVAAGLGLHRPPRRAPWMLCVVGLALFVAGDFVWGFYDQVLHRPAPVASLADALYLPAYLALAAGCLGFIRARGGRDPDAFLDASIAVAAGGMIAWAFVIAPAAGSGVPLADRMVVSSYPVMDLAVLAVLLRLLMTPGRRPTALLLVLVSFAVLLVGDAVYAVLQQTDSYAPGWLDATWLFAYLGLGVAALHPSMRELSTRDPRSTPTPLGWIRIWLLGSALLVGPILMVYAPDDRTIPVAGLTALISVLVLWRFVRTTRQRQRAEDSLTHSALHDPVTGLPNRRLLVDRLRQAIARNRRGGEGLAVLFLDLDRFKQVNDGLGHAAGDLLLGAIGQRLIGAVRPADTVARMGGDEFVIVCEGVRTPADAGRAADRIMDVLSRPFELPEGEAFVTASVGISMASRAGMSAEEMLHEADVAMYRAKLSGRDRRAFFDESMRVEAESRLQRANELHHALQREEFALLYQPLVALQGEAVVGVEALVRWHHPTEGLVAPDRFIPLAESTGLIVPLGRWIADAALAQAARWQAAGGALAKLSMAINVSAMQLREPGFADELIGLVGDRRVEPGRIYIELTESALIDDDLRAEEVLKKLRAAGLHLAIDDFGTGYSSLSYLQRYPVDRLKIDRSFVAGLDAVEGATAIVETILAMAATLGLDVIAEGVETPEQRDRLRGLGCAFGQGFLFGRPMPSEDLAALVGGWTSADASVLERMLMGGASPEPGP